MVAEPLKEKQLLKVLPLLADYAEFLEHMPGLPGGEQLRAALTHLHTTTPPAVMTAVVAKLEPDTIATLSRVV